HEGDGPRYAWARVERITPIYARSGYPVRREVCRQQPGYVVSQERYQQGPGSTAGTLLGAVIGGALGNQVGHGDGRAAATIAGAVIGGAVGNNATRGPGYYSQEQRYQPGYQSCQVQQGWRAREQVVGYDVTYRYRGDDFHTRTSYPPRDRIRVRVDQYVAPDDGGYGGG
ncbi:surface antigen domain protein, partial [mine drainage metagenome]